MNRWKIEITLNSGKELIVYYEGNEEASNDVANRILARPLNTFYGFLNEEKTQNILVRLDEIVAMAISVA